MAFRSSTQSGGDTCNMPAGATTNDILILFSSRDSAGNSATFPSGFTAFTANNLSGPDGQSYAAAWKRHTGSEPATLQVTFGGGGASQTTGCMAFSGRSTSSAPVAVLTTNTSANASPVSAPLTGVTALANDDICAIVTFDSDAGVENSGMTAPASYTLDINQWDNANFWSIIGGAHRDAVSAGATGNLTFTCTLLSGNAGFAGYVIRIPDNAADTTAPVLTSATGTATGATTATVGATTDEANGTMYCVVTTSATQPSVAQIKAGQNHTGAAASYASSQSITTTGAKTFNATGLTTGVAHYAHMVHTDAAANDSNRISSSAFTPTASGTKLLIQLMNY